MPVFGVEDYTEGLIPEDHLVRAQLEKVEPKTIEWTDRNTNAKKTADILEWYCRVVEGEYQDVVVRGSCDQRLSNHEGNRFRQWVEGFLGRELDVGEQVDTDDLIGLLADISVTHKSTDKGVFMNLDAVVPVTVREGDVPF